MKRLMAFTIILTVITASEALFFRLENNALDSVGILVCTAFNSVVLLLCMYAYQKIRHGKAPERANRRRSNRTECITLCILTSGIAGWCHAQLPQDVSVCEADHIAAFRGESLNLTYYGNTKQSSIRWSVTVGELLGSKWILKNVSDSTKLVSASAFGEQGSELCHFDVALLPDVVRANQKFTGTGFVTSKDEEGKFLGGYGMYTYLLFVHPRGKDDSHRYHTLLEAYFSDLNSTLELQKFLPRERINIFLLPVAQRPESTAQLNSAQLADWTLQHLDVAFSNALTLSLEGQFTAGPYIVSCRRPLSASTVDHDICAVQDLSVIPESMLAAWLQHVSYQAAHQDASFSVQTFALRLRTIIAQIAEDQPAVSSSVQKILDFRERLK